MIAIKERSRDLRNDSRVRIVFVAANRELLPDPVIPLGLLTLHAATPTRHDRSVLDLCFEASPGAALRDRLSDFEPNLVALSLRNLQSADYGDAHSNVSAYAALVQIVREQSDAALVLGGAGFSVLPEQLLEALDADYGVAGEGEWVFPRLVEALDNGAPAEDVPGVYWRRDGVTHRPTSRAPFVDLNSLGYADRRLVDPRHYRRSGIESVQTSRGCALACSYCTYPSIEGRQSRLRTPENVVRELEHIRLAAPDANHYFMVDSAFNRPHEHALSVCDAIAAHHIALPFTCYVNPLGFDATLAERMAMAGCVGVEIGSDSGDDATLQRLRKGFDTGTIREAQAAARAAGLLDCHTFVLGTPGETLNEVQRTLDFVGELEPAAAILMVWNDDAEAFCASGSTANRRELRAQILELLAERVPEQPRWVVPPLGRRFEARRFQLLRRRGLQGPLWQHLGDAELPARA